MAGTLAQCIRDPETAGILADRGRQRVIERYDWDTLADKLEEIWIDCANAHRLQPVGT
jgi:glycosyltransferase involved in cell wall biosynthesis